MREFIAAFELAAARPSDENRRACAMAGCRAMMTRLKVSQVAPVLAALFASLENRPLRFIPSVGHRLLQLMLFYIRQVAYRNRPMWNDFEMARWLLTHDPKYISRIHRQIHKPSKDDMVRLSGHWMVRSNIEQHADFAEQWRAQYPDCPEGCAAEIQQNVARLPDDIRQRAETIL
jgi:hypothetical protein